MLPDLPKMMAIKPYLGSACAVVYVFGEAERGRDRERDVKYNFT